MAHTMEAQIERNYAAFLDMRDDLVRGSKGRYALFHNRNLEGLFDRAGEAALAGFERFGSRNYSIQLITDEPIDLGFYSHALPSR